MVSNSQPGLGNSGNLAVEPGEDSVWGGERLAGEGPLDSPLFTPPAISKRNTKSWQKGSRTTYCIVLPWVSHIQAQAASSWVGLQTNSKTKTHVIRQTITKWCTSQCTVQAFDFLRTLLQAECSLGGGIKAKKQEEGQYVSKEGSGSTVKHLVCFHQVSGSLVGICQFKGFGDGKDFYPRF